MPDLIDIPPVYLPYESQEPFKECLVCGCDLTSGNKDYFVEKAIKNHVEYGVKDVVFEYAMCTDCAETMQKSMSQESQQNMQNYFLEHQGFMTKIQKYQMGEGESVDEILSKCSISNESTERMEEYMIFGHFRGDKMVASTMPYIIGGAAMDEISELLSNQTLGEMNDFMGQYFGGPTELKDLWKGKPVFF
ncbi:MAG: hypothetical protein KDC79_01795 [Cyclobacteriaceae bacterium]|nr:hypothetical protein [Cyclobacteriaceae bacterium]